MLYLFFNNLEIDMPAAKKQPEQHDDAPGEEFFDEGFFLETIPDNETPSGNQTTEESS